jgi:hypothetical protein
LSVPWQIGFSAAYRYQSANSATDSAFQLLAGPTFNLPIEEQRLQSAFFASALVGFTTGQTSFGSVLVNSTTAFTGALTVGKRFALSDAVAYAPSVGVVKEAGFDPDFTIQPISISVFF